jgi:hypothetical protein
MLREFALSASSASHSRESAGLPGESKTVAILSPFSTAKGGLRNRHPRREPHSALWGEREGPVAERREGEVGSTANRLVRPPHPALSPRPAGREGKTQPDCRAPRKARAKRVVADKFRWQPQELPFSFPRTALRDSDPRVKPTPDRRELSPGAEPAYSDAGRPLLSPEASPGSPRSRGRRGTL